MNPNVYIIAGPNGAGKITFAREFLPNYANCRIFVNADLIAQGMAPFSPESAAFRAGRLMLEEIEFHAGRGVDFGFETTLPGKGHLKVVRGLKKRGYEVHIFYLWVPSAELALSRVRERVLRGGHNIPEGVVRRRFERSIQNFLLRYSALADRWILFDNAGAEPKIMVTARNGQLRIIDARRYNEIVASHERP
ncbi:MAG: zeta toxin family protein [Candidatus Acidiferrales bacterium]